MKICFDLAWRCSCGTPKLRFNHGRMGYPKEGCPVDLHPKYSQRKHQWTMAMRSFKLNRLHRIEAMTLLFITQNKDPTVAEADRPWTLVCLLAGNRELRPGKERCVVEVPAGNNGNILVGHSLNGRSKELEAAFDIQPHGMVSEAWRKNSL